MSDQVRSANDELDWENVAHVFYLNVFFVPMEKLDLSATLSYTLAEAEMESPSMPSVTVTNGGGTFDGAYNPILMNNADEYSDLDYSMLELEVTGTYQIRDNLSFTLNYWYSDFDDDEPYVYGDLDGDAYTLTGFITWSF
ncbi:hypothetical protein TDIS_1110 [Thermosulfurimonas dismutans]|nr:hypothetical protein TDIS_1110 [Thermosulfurimonas dismutans]